MGFLRSKSRNRDDGSEPHRRNRLSKPMTSRSQSNLRTAIKQDGNDQEECQSPNHVSTNGAADGAISLDARSQAKSPLVDSSRENAVLPPLAKQNVKTGVAQLVARFETAQPAAIDSQSSFDTQPTKRPMSAIINTSSAFRMQKPQNDSDAITAASITSPRSPEAAESTYKSPTTATDPFSIPTRRRSHFKPGEATRKPSKHELEAAAPTLLEPKDDSEDEDFHSIYERPSRDALLLSTPTAHVLRSGTPRSLERTALGNFSLGSLHIVNGRASPALSELSNRRDARIVSNNRYVSSEYADSEVWEDDAVASETSSTGRRTPTNGLHRQFSYTAGSEQRMAAQLTNYHSEPEADDTPRTPRRNSPDHASVLAQEYMAELPASPYAEIANSSPTSSIGSVIHHKPKEDDLHPAFRDEGLGCSPQFQSRSVSIGSDNSSVDSKSSNAESKLSSVDSRFLRDEAYQSALEFQPPGSPVRRPAETVPSEQPRPVIASRHSFKSDSGYSSNNSLQAIPYEERIQLPRLQMGEEKSTLTLKENSPKKLGGFLPLRPVLKTRSTAPADSSVSTSCAKQPDLDPSSIAAQFTAPSPTKSDKSDKVRNKLKKHRPLSQLLSPKPPQEIVVQRNASVETYDVPEVSPLAKTNLGRRTQQLPELEKTVQTHLKQLSSSSSLAPTKEIRFPTPTPEPAVDERNSRSSKARARSRPRSKSRRRSFVEFFTGGDKNDRRRSKLQYEEQEIDADDLGDMVASLGANAYDVAGVSSRARNRSVSPAVIERSGVQQRTSYQAPRPRSMMDDKTASELARSRSRSFQQQEERAERRASFNDRGGVPGKMLRVSSMAKDAPPVPPMPDPAQLRRLSQRQSSYHSYSTSLDNMRKSWTGGDSSVLESSPAPAPPPHSPRPSFVDDHDLVFEEDAEDLSLAPPPPCHSPLRMDVSHNVVHDSDPFTEDGWATQALLWKARRQSAGEALRAKQEQRKEATHDQYYYEDRIDNYDMPINYNRAHPSHRYEMQRDDRYPVEGTQWQHDARLNGHAERRNAPHEQCWDDRDYDVYDTQQQYIGDAYYDQERPVDGHYWNHDQRNGQQQHWEYDAPYEQSSRLHNGSRGPSPTPSRPLPARPTSRHSYLSQHSNRSAVSLADELHPDDMSRKQPAPEFGRFSGGLQYSYEGREKGFGGSAGTRSVSGKADASWKGVDIRRSMGVDLGDVPIMGTAIRAS